MRAIRTSLLAMLAACGGGDSKEIDAMIIIPDAAPDAPPDAFEPTFDLTCMGNAAPTTAAANITVGGFVGEVVIENFQPALQAAHSADVAVCRASSATCTNADELDTQTTPMAGCPAMGCPFTSDAIATGGTPLDLYVKASKNMNLTSYIYPASPVTANVANAPVFMMSQAAVQGLAIIGVTQDPGKGIVLIALTDCANMPITDTANVTLSVKQGGQAVQGTTQLDISQYAPELAGTYAIFNVPAGTVQDPSVVTEVGATYKTTTLRAHEVLVFRDSVTGTQVRPGF